MLGSVSRLAASAQEKPAGSPARVRPSLVVHRLGQLPNPSPTIVGDYFTSFEASSILWGSTSGTMLTCEVNLNGTLQPLSNVNSTKNAVHPLSGLGTLAT